MLKMLTWCWCLHFLLSRLVGVAEVPPVEDLFMNTFLMLPTEALAVMKANLEFFGNDEC